MSPKCNHKCSYKRETQEGRFAVDRRGKRHTYKREGSGPTSERRLPPKTGRLASLLEPLKLPNSD